MPTEAELLERVRTFFSDVIPFNRFLQFELTQLAVGSAVVEVPFLPEYVGDVKKQIAHGGILSALIDVTGGATAFSVLDYAGGETSLNTVDMRVDYVRPGRGQRFIGTGSVLRKGSRICVTLVEVTNDEGTLIAHGTAAYSIFNSNR